MRAAASSSGASKLSFGTTAAAELLDDDAVKEGLMLLFAAVDVRRLAAPRFGEVTLEELAEVGREVPVGPVAEPLLPHDAVE